MPRRPPAILDVIQAVTDVAPSHPEVAVWWYARAAKPGAPIQLALEPRQDSRPDTDGIGAALATRLGGTAVVLRLLHGGSGSEGLYRVLTARDGPAAPAGGT
ncbi:MAG TPA: hypothetical protein VFW66_00440 [Gemmatimonadales bacterium]|nr:hypothetical protein [Gemmatimonadales bacterium]